METPMLKYHNLIPGDSNIEAAIENPSIIGLDYNDFIDMNEAQKRLKIIGEYYYQVWIQLGYQADCMLMQSYWGGPIKPNFFDHRSHILFSDNHAVDYWTLSADNTLRHLPLDGKLLSLCSGDGFYEHKFFSKRASEISAIDRGKSAMHIARKINNNAKTVYLFEDIFKADIPENHYDTVYIRSAIEHFSEADQLRICELAYKSLKTDGWFVGDTPASSGTGKLHTDHENEWKDESEMKKVLSHSFNKIETYNFVSKDRTTLFWACQK